MSNLKKLRGAVEQESRLAEHYFSKGDVAKALPHYRRVLLIDPESEKSRLRAGQCYERMGRLNESYDLFREMLSKGIARCEEQVQREILLVFTNLCQRLNREVEVIELFRLHPSIFEQTPALYYNVGFACFKNGRLDEARDIFDRIKSLFPKHAAGFIGHAILFCHLNQLDRAVKELQSARGAAPTDPQVIENLAVVQMKMGNYVAAVTTLRVAVSGGFSRSSKLFHMLGMAHLRLGELGLAERYLLKSLELDHNSEALREMGWLLIAKGQYPKSIELLKEALVINPNDIWAKVDLAIAYFKQGVTADARVLFDEAKAASPTPEVTRLLDDLARVITAQTRS